MTDQKFTIQQHMYKLDDSGLLHLKDSMRGINPPTDEDLTALVDSMTFIFLRWKTFCVITLKGSGYEVTGESDCMNPDKYNEEIGMESAQTDAIRKLFELEIYKIHRDQMD